MRAHRAYVSVVVVLAGLGAARTGGGQAVRALGIGQRAPGAPVQTLSGGPSDIGRYLGGKPVLIEFWGKWCPNCRQLEPKLRAARATYGSRVTFVTVAVSVDETPAEVAAYVKAHRFSPDVVYDASGAAVDAYGVPGTSYVVVVNRAGRIVYTGAGGDQDIVAAIKQGLR